MRETVSGHGVPFFVFGLCCGCRVRVLLRHLGVLILHNFCLFIFLVASPAKHTRANTHYLNLRHLRHVQSVQRNNLLLFFVLAFGLFLRDCRLRLLLFLRRFVSPAKHNFALCGHEKT